MSTAVRLLLVALLAACSHAPTTPEPGAPGAAVEHPFNPQLVIKAITAAGVDKPQHLDWGEKGKLPANQLMKNAKLLGTVDGNSFMAAMQSMEANIGKKCFFCHVEDHFELDDKDAKLTARQMMRMVSMVDADTFGGEARVTCYTCHRGERAPEKLPEKLVVKPPTTPLPQLSEADAAKPAGEVFKNIQLLKQVPAGKLPQVMTTFAGSLGVECSFCHVEGNYASDDKKEKKFARTMMRLTGKIDKDYFEGTSPVGCWTCHRGAQEPARTAHDPAKS